MGTVCVQAGVVCQLRRMAENCVCVCVYRLRKVGLFTVCTALIKNRTSGVVGEMCTVGCIQCSIPWVCDQVRVPNEMRNVCMRTLWGLGGVDPAQMCTVPMSAFPRRPVAPI